MAAVLWLGRPRLDQLLRHLLLHAPTSASSSPKLAKAELIPSPGDQFGWMGLSHHPSAATLTASQSPGDGMTLCLEPEVASGLLEGDLHRPAHRRTRR